MAFRGTGFAKGPQKRVNFTYSEVRKQVESSTLIDFCVVFTQDLGPKERILGSGTLVSIGNTAAVLTADHVLDKLPNPVRIFFPTRFDNSPNSTPRPSMTIEHFDKRTIGRGTKDAKGPDLGLVILHPSVIPSTKTLYNLTKRRLRVLENPRSTQHGIWAVVGAPAEWTEGAEPEANFNTVKVQRGVIGLGVVNKEYERDGFDYLEFSLNPKARYEGPTRFEGCSGGGLWHMSVEKNKDNQPVIRDTILSGVVFYQWLHADTPVLRCHGRKSVYENAFGVVQADHPSV